MIKKSITKFTTFQSWLGSPQLLGVQRCMSGHNFYMICDSTRAWEISKKQFVHPPFCMNLLGATLVGHIGNGPVSLSPLINTEIPHCELHQWPPLFGIDFRRLLSINEQPWQIISKQVMAAATLPCGVDQQLNFQRSHLSRPQGPPKI